MQELRISELDINEKKLDIDGQLGDAKWHFLS